MKLYASNDFLKKVKIVQDPDIQESIKSYLRKLKGCTPRMIIPELINCGNNLYCKKFSIYFMYLSVEKDRAILIDFVMK